MSGLPGLDHRAIDTLSAAWDPRGDGHELWSDIRRLVCRFGSAPAGLERTLAWHHLVMAVGNFKRQGGYRLRPASLDPLDSPGNIPGVFAVPGTSLDLEVENPQSWLTLNKQLPGAAAATVTTLLAALWPARHFIYDVRVHRAANALRLGTLTTTDDVVAQGTGRAKPTLGRYALLRTWLIDAADCLGRDLVSVERALYEADQRVGRPSPTGRTWIRYAEELRHVVRKVAS